MDELNRSLIELFDAEGYSEEDAKKLANCAMIVMEIGDISKSRAFNGLLATLNSE